MMTAPPPKLDYKNSAFALKTIKERWPVIIAQSIDSIYRNRSVYIHRFGEESAEKLKLLIGQLARLRYEVTTNKPLTLLSLSFGSENELNTWNEALYKNNITLTCDGEGTTKSNEKCPTWYDITWLLEECYLYRRIVDCVLEAGLPNFDPFVEMKQSGFKNALTSIKSFLEFLDRSTVSSCDVEKYFRIWIQADLFSNEFDLSLHIGGHSSSSPNLNVDERMQMLEDRLICDDVKELLNIWTARSTQSRSRQHTVAFVLDNAGPELLADLCFAEWLIVSRLTDRVVFCPKIMPWFVSDVTNDDIQWLLNVGLNQETTDVSFKQQANVWSEKWKHRFDDGSFSVKISNFWTFPHSYGHMMKVDPELYDYFTNQCDVIIFKGDYNYRKIVADRTWQPDSPEHKAMAFRSMQLGRLGHLDDHLNCSCSKQSKNRPDLASPFDCRCTTPFAPLIVSLRIAKSDVCVGLKPQTLENLCSESKDWWVIGKYGLIQIVSPIMLHI